MDEYKELISDLRLHAEKAMEVNFKAAVIPVPLVLEAVTAIQKLCDENAFLKSMQADLTKNADMTQLGRMVDKNLKGL